MRRLVLLAAIAAAAAGCGGTDAAIECDVRGEWPRTKDAAWVTRVVRAAGYAPTDCTGSAFVIDTGGQGAGAGHDLYIWTSRSRKTPFYSSSRARVAGLTVQYDRIRAIWRAHDRNVWVETGPTTPRLVPLRRLGRLVRASLEVD